VALDASLGIRFWRRSNPFFSTMSTIVALPDPVCVLSLAAVGVDGGVGKATKSLVLTKVEPGLEARGWQQAMCLGRP
jgi:hypothetical protein